MKFTKEHVSGWLGSKSTESRREEEDVKLRNKMSNLLLWDLTFSHEGVSKDKSTWSSTDGSTFPALRQAGKMKTRFRHSGEMFSRLGEKNFGSGIPISPKIIIFKNTYHF